MTTTLFEAAESAKILNPFLEQILPGSISLKICDNMDILVRKGQFLEQEIRKLVTAYGAVAFDPDNNDSRLVVKTEDGDVDEEKTKEFVNKVVELRKTEVDLDVRPFTEDDIERLEIAPVSVAQIRWMIER